MNSHQQHIGKNCFKPVFLKVTMILVKRVLQNLLPELKMWDILFYDEVSEDYTLSGL